MNLSELSELEINIEGYSGPFDLLCSLSEDGKFQLTGIKISQLIRIYGLYLIKTRQAPADTLAEFFYMSSGLLLEKTRSLLPGNNNERGDSGVEHEQEFIRTLERYRPYRELYRWLSERFKAQSLLFRRENHDENQKGKTVIAPEDSNLIAEKWKYIRDRHAEITIEEQELHEAESRADWNGFTESDDQQIDERVSEIEDMLRANHSLSFNELCKSNNIVTTLLALLELCRMGKALIEQEELFSDVRIITKT